MGDLGNVMLAQASLIDPEWAAQQFDRLWDAKNPIVRETLDAARTYYHAHAYRGSAAGSRDVRLSVPTGAAYADRGTGTTSYVVYNPRPYPVVVEAIAGREGPRRVRRPAVDGSRRVTKLETGRQVGGAWRGASRPTARQAVEPPARPRSSWSSATRWTRRRWPAIRLEGPGAPRSGLPDRGRGARRRSAARRTAPSPARLTG